MCFVSCVKRKGKERRREKVSPVSDRVLRWFLDSFQARTDACETVLRSEAFFNLLGDGSSSSSAMYSSEIPPSACRVSPSEVPASESEMPSSDEMESFFCFSRREPANPDDGFSFSRERTTGHKRVVFEMRESHKHQATSCHLLCSSRILFCFLRSSMSC